MTRGSRRARALVSSSGGLALLLAASFARTHDFSPGVLALVEIDAGRYLVAWTEPVDSRGAAGGVRVTFPPACRLERTTLDCGPDGLRGEIRFEGMHGARMQVVLSIRARDGITDERVVTASSSRALVDAPRASGAATWSRLGVEHILGGVDHVAFVLGLLLLLRRPAAQAAGARLAVAPRQLLATITAFTLAHSLTLGLAAVGVLRVSAAPVEATIAASVLLVAREAAHERPTWTRRAPWLVALLFGLVHGLGFAGALQGLGLPRGSIGWALLWFNLGVELGQLAVVAVVLSAVWLLRNRVAGGARLRAAACYALGAAAAWWFIERTATLVRG